MLRGLKGGAFDVTLLGVASRPSSSGNGRCRSTGVCDRVRRLGSRPRPRRGGCAPSTWPARCRSTWLADRTHAGMEAVARARRRRDSTWWCSTSCTPPCCARTSWLAQRMLHPQRRGGDFRPPRQPGAQSVDALASGRRSIARCSDSSARCCATSTRRGRGLRTRRAFFREQYGVARSRRRSQPASTWTSSPGKQPPRRSTPGRRRPWCSPARWTGPPTSMASSHFLAEVWPLVLAERPDARLTSSAAIRRPHCSRWRRQLRNVDSPASSTMSGLMCTRRMRS